MIDAVRLAYAGISARSAAPPGGLSIAAVGSGWVGYDDQYRPHLLLQHNPGDDELPDPLDAVGITTRPLVVDGGIRQLTDVCCLAPGLGEVFDHFVAAVLEHVTDDSSTSRALIDVLQTWRRFLHITPDRHLGRSQLAGVLGELLVVLDLTRIRADAGVRCWTGADRARHDFRSATRAVEVKVILAAAGHVVSIHGVEQLAAPQPGDLHLHLVRLEAVPGGGHSVASLVEDILDAGAAADDLYRRLADAGIAADQVPATRSVTFDIRERLTIPVDDKTPRIVPASFTTGHTAPGVSEVVYRTDLAGQLHRRLDVGQWTTLLHQLAAGTGL